MAWKRKINEIPKIKQWKQWNRIEYAHTQEDSISELF